MPTLVNNQSLSIQQLQNSITQRTDCIGHPQEQYGVIFGTQILASHTFSPKISVHSKNTAVDFAFVCPLYKGKITFNYRVLYIVALCTLTAFFQHYFHLISTHLAIYIVDLYLCQQPPSLYCCGGTLLAWRRFSTQCYSNSYISYSLSTACRRKVFWLISLGVLPF